MAQKEASDKNSENMLFKIAGHIAQHFLKVNPALIKSTIENLDLQLPKPDGSTWDTWADNLVKSGFVDQDTADLLKGVKQYNFPLNWLAYTILPLLIMMRDMNASMDIYGLDRQYAAQGKTTPHPAPLDNLVRSMQVDPKRANENREQLKRLGFDDTQIDNIILSYYRLVDVETIRINFLRGNITEKLMYERMRELGYTDTRTGEIVQTWKVLPGPQDLLTMVAKEAFEPDIYTKLGLSAEFPTEQVKWLKEQGISEAWAQKYWIAHWDQPSIGQGFEMLHRGVITPDELDLLFRAVEIPPYWRDKLTQIAYNPYTRVDVRRMHNLGIINDEQLVRSYMDLGFDTEKATKMAEFTIAFNAGSEKELTRGAILESYTEGLISRSDATDLLEAQDYSEDLADYYLTLADYNREKSLQSQHIDNIRERYLLSLITAAQARGDLNSLGLRGDNVDVLMDSWDLDRYKYGNIPSKSDLDRFLISGVITEGQYRSYMSRHGYDTQVIGWYLKEMAGDIASGGRKPTKAELAGWFKKGHLSREQWRGEMAALGYAQKYIDLYEKTL